MGSSQALFLLSSYDDGEFTLDSSDYLKTSAGYYVAYSTSTGLLFTVTSLSAYTAPLICDAAYEGVAMSCYPSGYDTYTALSVSSSGTSNVMIYMTTPSGVSSSNTVIEFVPEAV